MWYASCHVVVPAVMPIALPGRTVAAPAIAMACFSPMLRSDLASKPGSSVRAFVAKGCAAVHLQQQSGLVEQVEIAAHRHVADGQQRGQLADANGPAAAHLGDDDLVALTGQHACRDGVDRALDHDR